VGLHGAQVVAASLPAGVPVVTLATAHPAKFPDAVERAVGVRPSLPSRVGDLFGREEHFAELPGDYAAARDYVLARAAQPA
jgi:threonine synthase